MSLTTGRGIANKSLFDDAAQITGRSPGANVLRTSIILVLGYCKSS
jgi:hypothetical protein